MRSETINGRRVRKTGAFARRRKVETGLPFGSESFLHAALSLLGLESLLVPRDRP